MLIIMILILADAYATPLYYIVGTLEKTKIDVMG